MATPIASYLEQGARAAEQRKKEKMQVIDASIDKIKANLGNVQSVLIDYATKESFIRQCLRCAEQSVNVGDTAGILASCDAMRECLGMARIDGEQGEWTVDEILAHAG